MDVKTYLKVAVSLYMIKYELKTEKALIPPTVTIITQKRFLTNPSVPPTLQ